MDDPEFLKNRGRGQGNELKMGVFLSIKGGGGALRNENGPFLVLIRERSPRSVSRHYTVLYTYRCKIKFNFTFLSKCTTLYQQLPGFVFTAKQVRTEFFLSPFRTDELKSWKKKTIWLETVCVLWKSRLMRYHNALIVCRHCCRLVAPVPYSSSLSTY